MNDTRQSSRQAQPTPELLSEKLVEMIHSLPAGGVTLNHLLASAGQDGMMILTVLLSLVFLIPVSIPGVSTVFGAAVLFIALCRLAGRDLWLPAKLREREVATDKLRPLLQRSLHWLGYVERVARPRRMTWLVNGGGIRLFNNAALVLGAVLLMAPFGFIPFSNTFPALALICLAIGFIQRDGVCILLGHLSNLVTILYFGLLLTGGGLAVREAFRHFAG